MDPLWQFEIAFNLLLQHLGPWLLPPMKLFSFLGREEFYVLIMPAIYWCWDTRLGLHIGMMTMLSNGFNTIFKLLLHGSRPYWFDASVPAFAHEPSFGPPSGHAQNAASVWGIFAAKRAQKWVTILAVTMTFLIGLARIYLGVHYLSDVLLGWLLGAIILLAYLALEKPVTAWLRRLSLAPLFGVCLASSLLFIGLTGAAQLPLSGWEIPSTWVTNAGARFPDAPIDPLNMDGTFTVAGSWLGMTAGAAWSSRKLGGFSPAGRAGRRILRYLVGLVGILILWYGLGSILPRSPDLAGYTLRYLRYALIGAWATVGAPWLFLKTGLAGRTPQENPVQ
jgi:membrane-associated phospholipid phosphatase